MTDERLATLMVRVADGLASAAEERELKAHIRDHPELAEELDAHMSIKAVTDGWVARLDVDLAADKHQAKPTTQLEARIGLALFFVGIGVLGGFGIAELMLDAEAPLWVKIGTGSTLAGTLVLLLSVLRARLATLKHDAYTEIVR